MTTQLINVYHQQLDYCITWVIFMLFNADTSARHSISLTFLLTSVGQSVQRRESCHRMEITGLAHSASLTMLAKWQARHTTLTCKGVKNVTLLCLELCRDTRSRQLHTVPTHLGPSKTTGCTGVGLLLRNESVLGASQLKFAAAEPAIGCGAHTRA